MLPGRPRADVPRSLDQQLEAPRVTALVSLGAAIAGITCPRLRAGTIDLLSSAALTASSQSHRRLLMRDHLAEPAFGAAPICGHCADNFLVISLIVP
jgi:hypothetical protein